MNVLSLFDGISCARVDILEIEVGGSGFIR